MPLQKDGLMWGFQLWVNLPAKNKMTDPRYQDIPASAIPEVQAEGGVVIRVIAGEAAGARGPVEGIATSPLYLDLRIPAGASYEHRIAQPSTTLSSTSSRARVRLAASASESGELAVLSRNGEDVGAISPPPTVRCAPFFSRRSRSRNRSPDTVLSS